MKKEEIMSKIQLIDLINTYHKQILKVVNGHFYSDIEEEFKEFKKRYSVYKVNQ